MRPMRSRIREHQHMGLRQDRQADIQRQPFLRQHNRQEAESNMEETKLKLDEATAEFCTSLTELLTGLGMTMQQFQDALELAQARQELQKFDVLDFPNYEIYIDPDLREETREQHKLHLHHSSKRSLAATTKRKSRQPKGNTWIWNRIRSRPNTKHGYH